MRLLFSDVQNSTIPDVLGINGTADKFRRVINEAQHRLLISGTWWDTTARFRICTYGGCVTMPRQIATIEAVAMCGRPVPIRDFWFEFLENGSGLRGQNCCSCWPEAIMKGHFPTIVDIVGVTSKVLAVCDLQADVGAKVTILGYDINGNWIRTQQNGVWTDGEVITLTASPGTQSVNYFSSVTDVQASGSMNGQWWLYQYDPITTSQILLGNYQYDEGRPNYARYYFPSIYNLAAGVPTGQKFAVDIIGKKEFIGVKEPTDYMIISNIAALKEMAMAMIKSQDEQDGVKSNTILMAGQRMAEKVLNDELDHYLGQGRRAGITIEGSNHGAAEEIPNFL
jgi:hypothetical protein